MNNYVSINADNDGVVLCTIQRGKFTENIYRGWWVVVDANGSVVQSVAGISQQQLSQYRLFLRSAAKPFQALPLVLNGFNNQLTLQELAVICASHTASLSHQQLVTQVLQKAQVSDACLQCGAHMPLDKEEAMRLTIAGQQPQSLHHNCSGKHAGMLFYCACAALPQHDYLSSAHPLQLQIATQFKKYSGDKHLDWGVDGCSAPAVRLSLVGGAKLYAALASDETFLPIVSAMTKHPDMMGGEGRIDSEIIKASGGKLLAKVGADGVLAVSHLQKGKGLLLKLSCGNEWARNKYVTHLLVQLGWLNESEIVSKPLQKFHQPALKNNQGILAGVFQFVN